jgi:hypothetical protein
MDLFPNALYFFLFFTNIWQKSESIGTADFFHQNFKIHTQVWIFVQYIHSYIHSPRVHSCFLVALRSVEGLLGVPTGIRNSDLPGFGTRTCRDSELGPAGIRNSDLPGFGTRTCRDSELGPAGIRNPDLPYSKQTHYYLSCVAPWIFFRIVVCF